MGCEWKLYQAVRGNIVIQWCLVLIYILVVVTELKVV